MRGVWYVHLPSLLDYLDAQADRQAKEYARVAKHEGEEANAGERVPPASAIAVVA